MPKLGLKMVVASQMMVCSTFTVSRRSLGPATHARGTPQAAARLNDWATSATREHTLLTLAEERCRASGMVGEEERAIVATASTPAETETSI